MKKNAATIALGVLAALVLAAGIGMAVNFEKQLAAQRAAADASALRAKELEKQCADLKARVEKANALADQRSQEITRLRSQNGELEKKVADSKSKTDPALAVNGDRIVVNGQVIAPQLGQLDTNWIHLINDLRITQDVLGVGGAITINGQTIKLGDTQKLGDEEKKLDNVIKFVIEGINQDEPVKRQEKADEQF